MSEARRSLRQSAVLLIGTALVIAALFSAILSSATYQIALERGASEKIGAIARDYTEKLGALEHEWNGHLMREKTRLEFTRLLEDPVSRWDRLRAYLAALSDSPLYAGLVLCDGAGRVLFSEGPASSCLSARQGAQPGYPRHYVQDAADNLFIELDAPLWLGWDGMGTMHLLLPLDHAFLRRHAFPDTELFIEWQGRVIASSAGESGLVRANADFSGRIDRDGVRYEQRLIDFPASATPPRLLIQTRIQPPFTIAESVVMGVGVFALLALLLWLALRDWLARLVSRVECLSRAARLYADDGKQSGDLGSLLQRVLGKHRDELSDVALSTLNMVEALSLREHLRQDAEARLRESERRFREVAEFASSFIWEIDKHQNMVYVSDGAAEVFGCPAAQLRGSHFLDHVQHDEHAAFMKRVTHMARAGKPFSRFEVTILAADGRRRRVAFSGTPVIGAHGRLTGSYRGMAEDVTQHRLDEEKLRLAEKVFENSAQAILITDAAGIIVAVNPAFTGITGYHVDEALGATPGKFASGRHDAAFYASMWRALKVDGTWAGEVWDRRKNGEVYPKWLTINAVRDPESGTVTHYVGIFSDITEQKENEARIAHLAYHDPLTGLPNRYALNARLAQSLADARRNGTQLALMFIDLDRFKVINDSLGHDVGDQLLVVVARRIRAALRESDTVARLGGDEFVIVVPGVCGPEDAARVAEKIIAEVGAPLVLAGQSLHTSPSIGIGIFPADGHNADMLMKNADAAMYYAKQHGRNSFRFFTADMNTVASERLLLETQLHQAFKQHEFFLAFQPQVDLLSGQVLGAEALLRWQHPDHGEMAPESFIPIAEETGLIVALGAWVIEMACREAMTWEGAAAGLRVAVNVSVLQLDDRHLADQVAAILASTGLPAERLELEITESAVMQHPETTVTVLRALAALGVRLAIDDFGMGYSSLAYLKRLPNSRIKIDRSFIMDLETDTNDVAITDGIIALARSLGLAVTAEGIETPAQLAMLQRFGCAEGQGFLFSKPLTPAALHDYLATAAVAAPGSTLIASATAHQLH